MPKIIENLESKLMTEAGRQAEELGYEAMTIRSVAKACGVGSGTVYNYFASKDEMLAAYLLTDWKVCITAINAVGAYSDSPKPVIRCICDQLVEFARRHQTIFRDAGAVSVFSGTFSHYHGLLRSQIAAPIRRFCKDDFTADFIAESLLTWTMANRSFEELYGILEKLF